MWVLRRYIQGRQANTGKGGRDSGITLYILTRSISQSQIYTSNYSRSQKIAIR